MHVRVINRRATYAQPTRPERNTCDDHCAYTVELDVNAHVGGMVGGMNMCMYRYERALHEQHSLPPELSTPMLLAE